MYFWRMVTRGSTASAGSLLTVLSMRVRSALSRTLSRIRASLLCRPCTRSWVRVSVLGELEDPVVVVDKRDSLSYVKDM